MARDVGEGMLVRQMDGETQTVLLLYAGGPALAMYTSPDYGVEIANPAATFEDEAQFTTVCDYSGFTVKAGDRVRKTWDGLTVLDRFWEPRQPQDFVRSRPESAERKQGTPRAPDRFIGEDVPQVTAADL